MKGVFEKNIFSDLILHQFEDMQVPIPKNYDKILSQLYGNYMQKPTDEEIKYNSHNLIAYRIK